MGLSVLHVIYWDPPREMFPFVIPLLGRPLLWYGFFFALGFFLAYWVLVYLVHGYFLYDPIFRSNEVIDYQAFLKEIQKSKSTSDFHVILKRKILSIEQGSLDQKALANILNSVLKDQSLFNKSDYSCCIKKNRFFLNRIKNIEKRIPAENRLKFEAAFPGLFLTLRARAKQFAEKLTFNVIIGTIIGARLGDVLFYQDVSSILHDPLSIFKIWEGGLASHGGAIGILIAVLIFAKKIKRQYSHLQVWGILDLMAAPVALAAGFIRIGNFFNQEILGTPTTLPWAVVFGHPADGSYPKARHPVQIYESLFYFCLFLVLFEVVKRRIALNKQGRIFSLFLMSVFGFRFFIEFFKVEQSAWLHADLTMGQLLSIPFFLFGLILFLKRR